MKTFFKDLVTKHLRRGTHGSFSLFSNGKQEVTLFDPISDLVADMNVHDEKAFKAMVLGDFFRLHTAADALKTRNALKTFYRASQNAGRRFTVRPSGSDWFCRRVA